jgi:aminopeptidase N
MAQLFARQPGSIRPRPPGDAPQRFGPASVVAKAVIAIAVGAVGLLAVARASADPSRPPPVVTPLSSPPVPMHRPDPGERLRVLRGEEPPRPVPPRETESKRGLADPLDDYDLRHIRLEIDISDTLNRAIRGVTTQRVESRIPALAEVVFDLDASMHADSVRVDGQIAVFRHASSLLRVSLPEPRSTGQSVLVRVAYHGQVNGRVTGLRFQAHLGKAFVWTLSQPSNGRFWWPCKDRPDDKADSSDVLITAPAWMTATSNGLLRSVTPGEGTRTWWWHGSYPIAPYLVSVAAGDFVRIRDSYYPMPDGPSMLIEHFVFPELETQAAVDFNIAPYAIGAFADRFGPYPFAREKYGATVFGWGGAMEHQTNTSYFYGLIRGDHRFDWIYVHELGHQWWGDAVTCRTWADTWLNEGFASWTEAVWVEHLGGLPAYHLYMDSALVVVDPSGPLYDCPDPFDNNTIYNKGAWVVHMLRGVLGDSLFFRGLADYRALYEGRSVTTEEFRAVLETSSGRDLGWFFQEWVYGLNRPAYRIATLSEPDGAGQRVWIHLDQVQEDAGPFTMPVRLEARVGDERRERVLWNDPTHEDISFNLPAGPYEVRVDPDGWILRTVETGIYGLNIVTDDLAPAVADTAVDAPLAARGGSPPYAWLLLDPAPPGVALDPASGHLRGVPTLDGEFTFRVSVNDSAEPARSDTRWFTWKIFPSASDSGGSRAPAAGKGVRAAPNPVLRSVLLSFKADGTGPSEWTIFDSSGRAVMTAESPRASSDGTRVWTWDGRDRRGRRVAPGIYFVRGVVPGRPEAHEGRVLLLQ